MSFDDKPLDPMASDQVALDAAQAKYPKSLIRPGKGKKGFVLHVHRKRVRSSFAISIIYIVLCSVFVRAPEWKYSPWLNSAAVTDQQWSKLPTSLQFSWVLLQLSLIAIISYAIFGALQSIRHHPWTLKVYSYRDAGPQPLTIRDQPAPLYFECNPEATEGKDLVLDVTTSRERVFKTVQVLSSFSICISYIWFMRDAPERVPVLILAIAAILMAVEHYTSLDKAESHLKSLSKVESELKNDHSELVTIGRDLNIIRELQRASVWRKDVYEEIKILNDHGYATIRFWDIDDSEWRSYKADEGLFSALTKLVARISTQQDPKNLLKGPNPRLRLLFEPTNEYYALRSASDPVWNDIKEIALASHREVKPEYLSRNLLGLIHQCTLMYTANESARKAYKDAFSGSVETLLWNYKDIKKIMRDRDVARVLISCPKHWSYRIGGCVYDLVAADEPDEAYVRNLTQTSGMNKDFENDVRKALTRSDLARYAHYGHQSRAYILTCLLGDRLLRDGGLSASDDVNELVASIFREGKDQWFQSLAFKPFTNIQKGKSPADIEQDFVAFVSTTLDGYFRGITQSAPAGCRSSQYLSDTLKRMVV